MRGVKKNMTSIFSAMAIGFIPVGIYFLTWGQDKGYLEVAVIGAIIACLGIVLLIIALIRARLEDEADRKVRDRIMKSLELALSELRRVNERNNKSK
jgi:hypothetical protein